MKERRKRSSKSNLGSSRSLGSSTMLATGTAAAAIGNQSPSPPPEESQIQAGGAVFLPTVKEESPERHNLSQ